MFQRVSRVYRTKIQFRVEPQSFLYLSDFPSIAPQLRRKGKSSDKSLIHISSTMTDGKREKNSYRFVSPFISYMLYENVTGEFTPLAKIISER